MFDRFKDEKHNIWSKQVRERDHFRCVVCNTGREITAHHLMSYANYPDERYILSNGVSLCRRCHQNWFHNIYGRGNNTKEQFEEFVKIYQTIKKIILDKYKKIKEG